MSRYIHTESIQVLALLDDPSKLLGLPRWNSEGQAGWFDMVTRGGKGWWWLKGEDCSWSLRWRECSWCWEWFATGSNSPRSVCSEPSSEGSWLLGTEFSSSEVYSSEAEVLEFEMVGYEYCPYWLEICLVFCYSSTWRSWGLWTQTQGLIKHAKTDYDSNVWVSEDELLRTG